MTKLQQRPSGILVPETPEKDVGQWEPRLFTAHYFSDVQKFLALCDETPGARIEAVVKVPFLNIWGDPVKDQYVVIYQHKEALSMEICC